MTKQKVAENQIRLQREIQNAGYNIVTCGDCGSILLHEIGDDKIDCFCGSKMDLSYCPDYWYVGAEFDN